jgi:NAD+ diphosphatase
MESVPVDFVPGLTAPGPPSPADWLLIVVNDALLFSADGCLPTRAQVEPLLPSDSAMHYLGTFRGQACYYGSAPALTPCPGGFKTLDLRTILREQETGIFHLCCRAAHLLSWRQKHRYCGGCAQPLVDKPDELARQCPACGALVYPRISPAVIVAVIRGTSILLARSKRSRLNFYSVLAGFVEPGETLEECVRREVLEETCIAVKNIRYFASQPWPFPDSLMVGFLADYAGGDLCLDDKELETADWFPADRLPRIPDAPSISRRLIEWFIASNAKTKA